MTSSPFFYKFTRYEYWPWWLFYLPMLPYYLFQVLRTKSFTFPTAVNPGIYGGGFYGEKKTDILKNLPNEYLPTTLFIQKNTPFERLKEQFSTNRLAFPVIAKPNVGERGKGVEKISAEIQLKNYLATTQEDFLIQEFLNLPLELAILYSRLPSQEKGMVSSVTMKEFLSVTGDGTSTVEQLILKKPRASFQLSDLRKRLGNELTNVLPKEETKLLEPIGNHSRGTTFLNGNHLINNQLNEVFDKISLPFEGFFYGRFDLKVASLENLQNGQNIKIMELNGVSADPAHVYDPDYKLFRAYKDLAWHWKRLADIYLENSKRGHKPMSNREVWNILKSTFF